MGPRDLDYKSIRIHRVSEAPVGHGGFWGSQSELSDGFILALVGLYWVLRLVLVGFYNWSVTPVVELYVEMCILISELGVLDSVLNSTVSDLGVSLQFLIVLTEKLLMQLVISDFV